jgi:hypothetical protein
MHSSQKSVTAVWGVSGSTLIPVTDNVIIGKHATRRQQDFRMNRANRKKNEPPRSARDGPLCPVLNTALPAQ